MLRLTDRLKSYCPKRCNHSRFWERLLRTGPLDWDGSFRYEGLDQGGFRGQDFIAEGLDVEPDGRRDVG